ncbi:SdiA-regulated/phytase-like domain-containing protein [Microlunatus soli]|uniref:Uncharacterized protein n=1 Tax=Microlunatus soli TaxID=630515 RepID=A0A1H1REN0_9ACTN|nr:hypothetical protein [Microlunatus soli]SDS34214.1 hypothetical protein SAMN04489812_1622 [Microlunatus soli]
MGGAETRTRPRGRAAAWSGGPRVVLVAVLTMLLTLAWAGTPAQAKPKVAFKITDEAIAESSGLTRDPDRGLYWTVNDSGDTGRVFALNESGELQGTVSFRAQPTDVEAVGYHDGSLYVADIGDNESSREFVTVYALFDTEPNDSTVLYHAYDFAYPDGPHDAETLLIDGDGRISLVTKGKKGAIYQAPEDPSRSEVNTLTRVADAPGYVTDGQVLDDGRIALRSYVDVKIIDPEDDYRVVAKAATPFQPQGESLSQELDGDGLLVGSEGKDSAVYRMDLPDRMGDAPSAGASPPESAEPSPSPSARQTPAADGAAEDTDPTSGGARGGTTTAVLIAAAVAIVAGGAVYLLRGRARANK